MASKESQLAAQVRLNQWALDVQECKNRPKDMTVEKWCEQRGITKANYYRRLKRVRQTHTSDDNTSTAAILCIAGGISIENRENATAELIKKLIGAVSNAQ